MILLGTGMVLSAVWLAPHVAGPMSKTYPYLQQSGAMIAMTNISNQLFMTKAQRNCWNISSMQVSL
jgi:hypothetical protein